MKIRFVRNKNHDNLNTGSKNLRNINNIYRSNIYIYMQIPRDKTKIIKSISPYRENIMGDTENLKAIKYEV